MRKFATAIALLIAGTTAAEAGLIDTFTRSDGGTITDSVGMTEVSSYDYVERGNTPGQAIPIGTAEISNNQLLITGSQQTTTPVAVSNTGGAYLSGSDHADVRVEADLAFQTVGPDPTGVAGANGNKFNNTFLLMLRSRVGQSFATNAAIENGLVAIEFAPNADLLIREQRPALTTVISRNYFTNAGPVREPLATGVLPATFGSGSFDVNGNGYLDANEPFHFAAELIGTQLKIFINGAQYGVTYSVVGTSAAAGQLSGIGLHKNRIGGTNVVASNILLDNLAVTPIPEPTSAMLLEMVLAGLLIRRSNR
jgi:hypothetical protein